MLCFSLVNDKFLIYNVVTQRRSTSGPHALLLGCRYFVPNTFARDFAFELGEGEEDVEREAPHGCGCIELLGDRCEGCVGSIQDFHYFGEVHQ